MNKVKMVSVTEEQIIAIGTLTSLGEAMGHEVMTKLAREFLEEASHCAITSDSLRGKIAYQLQVRNRHVDMPTMRAIVDGAFEAAAQQKDD